MTGSVRSDLHSDLLRLQRKADLVLALGTSLAGMGADQLVGTVADRARRGQALGAVIVSLQQTVRYADAALRIFAPLDRVAALLASELDLDVCSMDLCSKPDIMRDSCQSDVFSVPYDADGHLVPHGLTDAAACSKLDLSPGTELTIKGGPDDGMQCVVQSKSSEGHYILSFPSLGEVRLLGSWWIEAALQGQVERIPCVTCS